MHYELFYWPMLQGRGEFVRLALEDAGASYTDVARGGKAGMHAMQALLDDTSLTERPFAPPFLKAGDEIVSQTANILAYLGPRLGLLPKDEKRQRFAQGLQLTIADVVAEAHDTHHPLASGLYYEDQKAAAKTRAGDFIDARIPKFLSYFESVAQQAAGASNGGPSWMLGDAFSYVDLSIFQLLEGLRYAFPRGTTGYQTRYPNLARIAAAVAERPRLAAYLASPRRIAFNESGIFRHYPELDREPRSPTAAS